MNFEDRNSEFSINIWDHIKDPLQVKFDLRRKLTETECAVLQAISNEVKRTEDDSDLAAFLKKHIEESEGSLTALLLQLCGLTRTKIITDLKPYRNIWTIPSGSDGYKRLHRVDSWQKSGPYLAASLRKVLHPLARFNDLPAAFEALNQATYPGYIRQERAKRSGHEAEYRLAVLLYDAKLPFEPIAKLENKPGADVKINGISYDLVVPSREAPKVVIMSAAHIAPPGQYGLEKAKAVEAAKISLNTYEQHARPTLLVLVDGVGLDKNRAVLNPILTNADEFCQFSTLWKAVVIAADKMGLETHLFGPKDYFVPFQAFLSRYPNHSISTERPQESIEAGSVHVSVR